MAGKFHRAVLRAMGLNEDKLRRVMQASIQNVVDAAQTTVAQGGDMPVITGFLRNSLVSGLDGQFGASGPDSHVLVIAGMDIGDSARFGWAAEYARPRHYMVGVGQGGGLWRDKATARWQSFVDRNAAAVR